MNSEGNATIAFDFPEGGQLKHLWLVVMGAPTAHTMNPIDFHNLEDDALFDNQWPYAIRILR
jgi:hypothetical protein